MDHLVKVNLTYPQDGWLPVEGGSEGFIHGEAVICLDFLEVFQSDKGDKDIPVQ
jgi:hypothetical protein